jgi:spermidine/putrescine transport system permease protein
VRFSLGKWLLPIYVVIAFILLIVPIAQVIIYSFNDSRKNNTIWGGWTLDKWTGVCDAQGICEAFGTSVLVGIVATILATVLGTMLAIAIGRYRFRGRGTTSLGLFLPMATPEVVLGAGLAAQFLAVGVSKGFWTIVIVHALFCLSFVVVTVKARVASLDPALEEAGRDLYGSGAQVFFRVTLPLLTPGIVAAALLSFALSFDDFIITKFNAGQITTFPLWIYTKKSPPAEANVIASAIFILAIVAVIVTQVLTAARRKRLGITQ